MIPKKELFYFGVYKKDVPELRTIVQAHTIKEAQRLGAKKLHIINKNLGVIKLKAKVLNPKPKKRTSRKRKETIAERKARMKKVRSFKGKSKTTRKPKMKSVTRKTIKQTVVKNPLSVQMKRSHNFISKIIIALESGHKVELEKKDLTVFRYILKNL